MSEQKIIVKGTIQSAFDEIEATSRNIIERILSEQARLEPRLNPGRWWEGQLSEEVYHSWVNRWEQEKDPQKSPLEYAHNDQLRLIMDEASDLVSRKLFPLPNAKESTERLLDIYGRMNGIRNKVIHDFDPSIARQESILFKELLDEFFTLVPSNCRSFTSTSSSIITYLNNICQDICVYPKDIYEANELQIQAKYKENSKEKASSSFGTVLASIFLTVLALFLILVVLSNLPQNQQNPSVSEPIIQRQKLPPPTVKTPPRFTKQSMPVYPLLARQRGITGSVTLDLELSTNGRVGNIKFVKRSGHHILDVAALNAAKKWTHVPAKRNGVAITTYTRYTFNFPPAERN